MFSPVKRLATKIVSRVTYDTLSGTLNPTAPTRSDLIVCSSGVGGLSLIPGQGVMVLIDSQKGPHALRVG